MEGPHYREARPILITHMYLHVKTEVPTEKDEGISSSNNNNGEGISADSGKVYTTVKLNTN